MPDTELVIGEFIQNHKGDWLLSVWVNRILVAQAGDQLIIQLSPDQIALLKYKMEGRFLDA